MDGCREHGGCAESKMLVVLLFCCHGYDVNVVFDVVDVLGRRGALSGIRTHLDFVGHPLVKVVIGIYVPVGVSVLCLRVCVLYVPCMLWLCFVCCFVFLYDLCGFLNEFL